jgi:hypothetical protein
MNGLGDEIAKAAGRAVIYWAVTLVMIAIAAFVLGRCSV